ncbi:MAG: hypothetical protein AVDCRST_MAG49-119 [uncultured Thermomicrobiales bacterium]|uniref:Uncharacterized protein n=1 Tax=uncultured Thermomicrobiales bacterium TaxID=1645740 RepID=A0A6J4TYG7_9BACT|nr:MAG: hypothetical protein AVDCRST_MAG49-119 [uncultured Thermomicrobiales bacterium]
MVPPASVRRPTPRRPGARARDRVRRQGASARRTIDGIAAGSAIAAPRGRGILASRGSGTAAPPP